MPDLLDLRYLTPEGLGERRLGDARRGAGSERPRQKFDQGKAALDVEPVKQALEHSREGSERGIARRLDDFGQARRRLAVAIGPQKRDRLGGIADIVARQAEQYRIDPGLEHDPERLAHR